MCLSVCRWYIYIWLTILQYDRALIIDQITIWGHVGSLFIHLWPSNHMKIKYIYQLDIYNQHVLSFLFNNSISIWLVFDWSVDLILYGMSYAYLNPPKFLWILDLSPLYYVEGRHTPTEWNFWLAEIHTYSRGKERLTDLPM